MPVGLPEVAESIPNRIPPGFDTWDTTCKKGPFHRNKCRVSSAVEQRFCNSISAFSTSADFSKKCRWNKDFLHFPDDAPSAQNEPKNGKKYPKKYPT